MAEYFSKDSLLVFERVPSGRRWGDVDPEDQKLFKALRLQLKNLVERIAEKQQLKTQIKTFVSHPTPNGNSPRELWCCIFPKDVANKSFAFQLALILSKRGAEICFCLGSGTHQSKDPAMIEQSQQSFNQAKVRLKQAKDLYKSSKTEWKYKIRWLDENQMSDVATFTEWVDFAASPQGNSASISKFIALNDPSFDTIDFEAQYFETLQQFGDLFDFIYSFPSKVEKTSATVVSGLKIPHKDQCELTTALLTKPFLIFTGLSGSGKSRAAKQFARSFSKGDSHYHFAAVGPDWNNRDPLLGYPDGIHPDVYLTTPVLELLIKAKEDNAKPYFLILDEMNLSHVERYFADFLSAMESDEVISLYEGNDRGTTPKTIIIPPNFFIIGTVNIDETTYQFSPKVLDRANVIEFKMEKGDVVKFFVKSADVISPEALEEFAEQFVEDAKTDDKVAVDWASGNETFKKEMQALFDLLKEFNGEFGYRTLKESSRYLYFHDKYSDLKDEEKYRDAMDHIIIQKLLPKLHGSRSKLEGILRALLYFCESPVRTDMEELKTKALTAATETNTSLDMLGSEMEGHYKLSHNKLRRMCRKLHQDQFVSFADA
jgi:MoxR-like ATPase